MDPVVGLALVGAAAFGITYWALLDPARRGRQREVLPSHYSSRPEGDPSRFPGRCPDCATSNDPGFRFCKECGTELSGSESPAGRVPVSRIFDE
ncbi:zinc ribbon domain-containing protein [Halomicrobium salinisoli]|uniref:zinc ribbon domain-containing protein n=1 Tax=Halomicrobium salinisoli TaxID=2878391 RepID=UPI001CF03EC4|nr:zinc ribbon domain-containing protein [Halomicrobium salinisoli]